MLRKRRTGFGGNVTTDVNVTDVRSHRIHDHHPNEAAIEVTKEKALTTKARPAQILAEGLQEAHNTARDNLGTP